MEYWLDWYCYINKLWYSTQILMYWCDKNLYHHLNVSYYIMQQNWFIVTRPGKQILSTQSTLVCIMAHISCSVCANHNHLVLLNSSWISTYKMTTWNTIRDKRLLHFKVSKSSQILRVDKTCFPKPGHTLSHL